MILGTPFSLLIRVPICGETLKKVETQTPVTPGFIFRHGGSMVDVVRWSCCERITIPATTKK